MSLLEQNTTKKEWIDKNLTEFEADNIKKYEIEAIWDSIVYINKTEDNLYNAKVMRPPITWSNNFILRSYLVSNQH